MQGNSWKLAVAFVIGAVLSFLAGMYVLGPLFVPHQSEEVGTEVQMPSHTSVSSLAESVPNRVYRRDVDSVPDHTAVIVERVQRPVESPPETSLMPEVGSFQPYQPQQVEQAKPPRTPFQLQPSRTPERREPEISEPIPPPTEVQPPQPPISSESKQLPPPPTSETKRAYRVRVGVFSQEENAKRWLETLTSLGYYPYTEEEVVGGQKRFRVYVGAFDNRESAERLRQELKAKGVPGMVEENQE
ncbi:MAG: SPOR domain-containing protein [Candidatus Fervidibacter sp.]|uniref:SPOR domain-containing protein n=1 Tax=Candidatus Fervidibacter sp. TaxID=3100871 RepID=UPI00404A837D